MQTAHRDKAREWIRNSVVVQPWSDDGNEDLYVKHPEKHIRILRRFGINTITLIPTEAHNHMSRRGDRNSARCYTDEQFATAVKKYQAAGIRVQLYSCLAHVGHHPSWNELVKKRPAWLARDQHQAPFVGHGDYWFCPNNDEPFLYVAKYTCELVGKYGPDAILLDNNFMCQSGDRLACYCAACRKKFREYIGQSRKLKEGRISIPQKRGGLLYEEWIDWRYRNVAQWTERLRDMLRGVKPDVVLVTNHLWSCSDWAGAQEDQCPIVDVNLTECYRSPAAIGLVARMAQGFSGRKRHTELFLCTWERTQGAFSMRAPDPIKVDIAATIAHQATPWLVAYGGWDVDETTASSRAIKRYLTFYDRFREYYAGAESYARLALCHSRETLDHADDPTHLYPQKIHANLVNLMEMHVPFDIVHTRDLSAEVVHKYKAILFPKHTRISDATLSCIERYVRAGGTAVFTEDLGTHDGMGRKRSRSVLAAIFGGDIVKNPRAMHAKRAGRGAYIWVRKNSASGYVQSFRYKDAGGRLLELIERVRGARTIATANCPSTVEVIPAVQTAGGKKRYVVHIVNNDGRGVMTGIGVVLRAEGRFRAGRVILLSPDMKKPIKLPFRQNARNVSFTVPELRIYSIVVVEP